MSTAGTEVRSRNPRLARGGDIITAARRRFRWWVAGVFVLTFTAMTAMLWPRGEGGSTASAATPEGVIAVTWKSPSAPESTNGSSSRARSPDPDAEPRETLTTSEATSDDPDVAASLAPEDALSAETSGAPPADVRADALREASATGGTGIALYAETLRTDPFARNRILAIAGLRRLAADPALAPQVVALLRAAQSDADENVAANARDTLAEKTVPGCKSRKC